MTLASHSLIWWSASGTSARPVELAILAATLEYTETLDSDKKNDLDVRLAGAQSLTPWTTSYE